jgi:CRP-like cAMP-binding protein
LHTEKQKKHVIIGFLGRGESFGEHSALNDLPNPFSIEAATPKVEVYKILRAHFVKYFGGLQGEPVEKLRA